MERRGLLHMMAAAGLTAVLLPQRTRAGESDAPSGLPAALSLPADRLVVTYRDGTRVDAGGGRLVWRAADGRILDDRPLDPADIALLQQSLAHGGETLLQFTADPDRAEIRDWRGWCEVMERTHYRLTDPKGRVVRDRPLAARDIDRLDAMKR